MMQTIEVAKRDFTGLCFVNLVDFDAVYGHRRNALGYAQSVEEFDKTLETLLPLIKEEDLLIICVIMVMIHYIMELTILVNMFHY